MIQHDSSAAHKLNEWLLLQPILLKPAEQNTRKLESQSQLTSGASPPIREYFAS